MSNAKTKTKKKFFGKTFWTIVFILLNVAVIAYTAFSEFGNTENASKLSEIKINWLLLIPAFACFIIAIILEIYKYVLMMKKTCNKPNWKVARRTVLIGRYYDNITPAAIGGQPFQIYYMHKNGNIPEGFSTTIPLIGMISGQIGFLIIAIIAFLFGSVTINDATLMVAACFGLIFYAFWPISILVATFLPKTTAEIINLGVKFLTKIHIIKNREEAEQKAEQKVQEYAKCVKTILKTRGLFLKTIILSIIFHILIYSIPFIVLTAFGGQVEFLPCFVMTLAATAAVYFVPTPGNAGAAEGAFFSVFSALSSGYVFWAMLIWRFFTYYIYIIAGGITYLFMYFENKNNEHPLKTWGKKFKNFFKDLKPEVKPKA